LNFKTEKTLKAHCPTKNNSVLSHSTLVHLLLLSFVIITLVISTSSLFRIEGSHDEEEPVISSEKGLINEYGEVVILDAPTIANQALYVV
jgi:hypothetical protein